MSRHKNHQSKHKTGCDIFVNNTHALNVCHWLPQDKHLELLLALVSADIGNRAHAFWIIIDRA